MKAYILNLSTIPDGIFGVHIFNFSSNIVYNHYSCNHSKSKIKAPIN